MLRGTIRLAAHDWITPWFAERYGNGRLIRDTGVVVSAVSGDWSRGVSIEQLPGSDGEVAYYFALCRVLLPGGFAAPPVRRLVIRSADGKESGRIVRSLLQAWIVDEAPESADCEPQAAATGAGERPPHSPRGGICGEIEEAEHLKELGGWRRRAERPAICGRFGATRERSFGRISRRSRSLPVLRPSHA